MNEGLIIVRPPFLELPASRVLVFDGAMGTSIHTFPLDVQRDYLGLENCSEILVQTRPDVIRQIHEAFLAVGCDAVETDTFGANKIVLGEFGIAENAFELNRRAAEIAREACQKYETAERPRYVIGSIGPGTKLPTLGHTTFDILQESYAEQCRGLIAGGADVLLIETCQDLLLAKAAINGATRAMAQKGIKLPLMVQVTIEAFGDDAGGGPICRPWSRRCCRMSRWTAWGSTAPPARPRWGSMCSIWRTTGRGSSACCPMRGLPVIVDGKGQLPADPARFRREPDAVRRGIRREHRRRLLRGRRRSICGR